VIPIVINPITETRLELTEVNDATYMIELVSPSMKKCNIIMTMQMGAFTFMTEDSVS
jgi:hypothetical protein